MKIEDHQDEFCLLDFSGSLCWKFNSKPHKINPIVMVVLLVIVVTKCLLTQIISSIFFILKQNKSLE
jgi:hypothetical protein